MDLKLLTKIFCSGGQEIHEDSQLESHIGIKNLIFKKFRKNLDLVNLN